MNPSIIECIVVRSNSLFVARGKLKIGVSEQSARFLLYSPEEKDYRLHNPTTPPDLPS